MQIYSKMDVGKIRNSNQDAYDARLLDDGSALAVVCDGMGGANAGNVASESTVKIITEYVMKSYTPAMNIDAVVSMLKGAITSANIETYDMSLKNPNLSGMGTTAVVAFVRGYEAIICHVGDSRAYIVNDEVRQLTRDHSVVQTLIEDGKLTPEEAKVHPRKNIITRAIGTEEDVIPDCGVYDVSQGDTVLICTDGLSNFIETAQLLEIFKTNDISTVADLLVDTANENGGGDNITVVTVTL